jgi:hypothetical protein
MSKDAVATMGGILPDDAGGRDAVHVAVFSATSVERLFPGQDVSIAKRDEQDAVVTAAGEHVGIVDPFLRGSVEAGARFWVYLYPRTITALSHRWSHPAFEGAPGASYAPPSAKLQSEEWLRGFVAMTDCPSYETVLALAAARADMQDDYPDDEYLLVLGSDAHGSIPPEFWDHVENIIGRPIRGKRATFFSCSC